MSSGDIPLHFSRLILYFISKADSRFRDRQAVADVKIVMHRKESNARFFVVKTFKGHHYVSFMRPSVCRHVLVKIRDQLGLQQKELANLVGCSTSTIKRIERGSLGLSRGLARKISERLGVSMNYLSDNDLRKNPVTDSGEKWTRQTVEKLGPRDWGKMKPYDRHWKLLYCGILMWRYQEYRGMNETLPKL